MNETESQDEVESNKVKCRWSSKRILLILTLFFFGMYSIAFSYILNQFVLIFYTIIFGLIAGYAYYYYILDHIYDNNLDRSFKQSFFPKNGSRKKLKDWEIPYNMILTVIIVVFYPVFIIVLYLSFHITHIPYFGKEPSITINQEEEKIRESIEERKGSLIRKIYPLLNFEDRRVLFLLTVNLKDEEIEKFLANRVKIDDNFIIELDLTGITVSEMFAEICKLSELKKLIIRSSDNLEVPQEIGILQSLESLDLSENQLTEVPPQLANLESLLELNLSHNQLETFPTSEKGLPSLISLDLSHNNIRTVFESIGEFKDLQILNLENNEITFLPNSILDLAFLQELYLGNNQILFIPEFNNLRKLFLAGNPLVKEEPESNKND